MQPGERTDDTKRRVSYRELLPDDPARAEAVRRLIQAVSAPDARLITTEGTDAADGAVEVAHEALIRGWGRLRRWVDDERPGLRLHHQLEEAAREWEASGRDSSFLYGGARLAVVRKWARTHRDDLSAPEVEFLSASQRKWLGTLAARAVPVLVLAAMVIGSLVAFQTSRRLREDRRRQIEFRVEKDLAEVKRLRDDARAGSERNGLLLAIKVAEGARQRLLDSEGEHGELPGRLESVLAECRRDEKSWRIVGEVEEARVRWPAERVLSRGGRSAKETDAIISTIKRAFRDCEIAIDALSAERVAELIRAQSPELRVALVEALDDWAEHANTPDVQRLLAIARQADPDPWPNKIRDAVEGKKVEVLRQLARDPDVAHRSAATLVRLGSALAVAESRSDAVALLREAQRLYPNDFWINKHLSNIFFDLSIHDRKKEETHTAEAVRYGTVAVSFRPDSPGSYNSYGIILERAGRGDEAAAAFGRAVELGPDLALAWDGLGSVLRNAGKRDEAIAAYRKATKLEPEFALAWINLGSALSVSGKRDEAIAALRKATKLWPAQPFPYTVLGDVLAENGQLDEAISVLRKATELKPEIFLAFVSFGRVLAAKGHLDEAIPALRKATELEPGDADSQYLLGSALCARGSTARPWPALRKAVELKPDHAAPTFSSASHWRWRGISTRPSPLIARPPN